VLAYQSYTNVDLQARPEAMAMSMIIAALSAIMVIAYMNLTRRYVRAG
jgi:ABC-type spermidine/putrescine transport system permease subunit II